MFCSVKHTIPTNRNTDIYIRARSFRGVLLATLARSRRKRNKNDLLKNLINREEFDCQQSIGIERKKSSCVPLTSCYRVVPKWGKFSLKMTGRWRDSGRRWWRRRSEIERKTWQATACRTWRTCELFTIQEKRLLHVLDKKGIEMSGKTRRFWVIPVAVMTRFWWLLFVLDVRKVSTRYLYSACVSSTILNQRMMLLYLAKNAASVLTIQWYIIKFVCDVLKVFINL